jgi:hypothetical protein
MADKGQALRGKALLQDEAKVFGDFCIHLAFDLLRNTALIISLSVIFFAAERLKHRGLDP